MQQLAQTLVGKSGAFQQASGPNGNRYSMEIASDLALMIHHFIL